MHDTPNDDVAPGDEVPTIGTTPFIQPDPDLVDVSVPVPSEQIDPVVPAEDDAVDDDELPATPPTGGAPL